MISGCIFCGRDLWDQHTVWTRIVDFRVLIACWRCILANEGVGL